MVPVADLRALLIYIELHIFSVQSGWLGLFLAERGDGHGDASRRGESGGRYKERQQKRQRRDQKHPRTTSKSVHFRSPFFPNYLDAAETSQEARREEGGLVFLMNQGLAAISLLQKRSVA